MPSRHAQEQLKLYLLIFNPLNADLNPICRLLALLGAHRIFHISELRVNRAVTSNIV